MVTRQQAEYFVSRFAAGWAAPHLQAWDDLFRPDQAPRLGRRRARRPANASSRLPVGRTTATRDRDPRGDGWVAPLWWADGVGQAVPGHLRLRRT
jgi:hypothetical protein